jgi:hypothetical protein
MATLVEWLNEALSAPDNPIKCVLVLQIRAAPPDQPNQRNNKRGWLYQIFAPLATMLHVRNAGQFSHNQVEIGLLDQVRFPNHVEIKSVVFEFSGKNPPLSWHLTQRQKEEIEQAWRRELEKADGVKIVKGFLSGATPLGCEPQNDITRL